MWICFMENELLKHVCRKNQLNYCWFFASVLSNRFRFLSNLALKFLLCNFSGCFLCIGL